MTARKEKVRNKALKEKIRGGTKSATKKPACEGRVGDPTPVQPFLNKLICGDAEEVLRLLPAESIDLIVTSPPYNFGHEYAEDPNEDTLEWDEYFEKLLSIWTECVRIMKPGGRLCVNVQPVFSDYVPTHHIISNQLLRLGLLWKAEILWEKSNYNAKYTAWGSWCSPSMPYLKYTWEFIEVFDKESHKKPGRREDIDIRPDEFKKWVYAKWQIAPETRMKRYDHPAVFPEEVPKRLVKLFSYRNDIVLDPFNGVGTTSLVAIKLGRRFIGIDVSEKYCRTALKRIRGHLSQHSVFGKGLSYEPELRSTCDFSER